MTFGEKLKATRLDRGMTQAEFGDLLGCSRQSIGLYESGKRTPKLQDVMTMAEKLKMNPADLDRSLIIDLGSDSMYQVPDPMLGLINVSVPSGSSADLALSLTRMLSPDQLRQLSDAVYRLNGDGVAAMVDRVAEVAEIPKYQQA